MYPCEYFINSEKGVVVCKMYDTEEALVIDLAKRGLAPAHEEAYMDTLISDCFVGKAVCKPEDVFDAEVGKKIAYKKAVKKMAIAKKKALKKVLDITYKSYQYVSDLAASMTPKLDNVIKSCDEQIIRLAGGSN